MKCPVKVASNGHKPCDVEFEGTHYTLVRPHLETHTVKELSKALHSKMGDLNWAATMGKEIIEKANTLVRKGDVEG